MKRREVCPPIPYPEPVSKLSIGFEIKEGSGRQPQEYMTYFEDWLPGPDAEIGPEGRF
jgi:hypothetical protein